MRLLVIISLAFAASVTVVAQPNRAKGKLVTSDQTKTVAPPGGSPAQIKCAAATPGLTSDEMSSILAAHNKLRAAVKTPPLQWDCDLAANAQEWASRDLAQHSDTAYGENIFVSTKPDEPISTIVERWAKEKDYWDNTKAACAEGRVCTHYTQAVWKKTSRVGCGISRNGAGSWKTIVVCNYDPAGNWPGPAY